MIVLKISLMLVGILFAVFGYFIFFKGKYNLINNFAEDKKKKKYDDNYARRVGLIEFTGGIVIFTLGVFSMFFNNTLTIIVFIISIFTVIVALLINLNLSIKFLKR